MITASHTQISEILKTLPIGLYLGDRTPVVYEETGDSYANLMDGTIHVSGETVMLGLAHLPSDTDPYEFENAIRAILYHELSHIIMTPKTLKNDSEKIINCFEDERIETLLFKYYLGVDFKKMCLAINGWTKDWKPMDARMYFYGICRFRQGPAKFVRRVAELIHKWKSLRADANEYRAEDYRDDVMRFWDDVRNDWNQNRRQRQDEQEQRNQERNQREQQQKQNQQGQNGQQGQQGGSNGQSGEQNDQQQGGGQSGKDGKQDQNGKGGSDKQNESGSDKGKDKDNGGSGKEGGQDQDGQESGKGAQGDNAGDQQDKGGKNDQGKQAGKDKSNGKDKQDESNGSGDKKDKPETGDGSEGGSDGDEQDGQNNGGGNSNDGQDGEDGEDSSNDGNSGEGEDGDSNGSDADGDSEGKEGQDGGDETENGKPAHGKPTRGRNGGNAKEQNGRSGLDDDVDESSESEGASGSEEEEDFDSKEIGQSVEQGNGKDIDDITRESIALDVKRILGKFHDEKIGRVLERLIIQHNKKRMLRTPMSRGYTGKVGYKDVAVRHDYRWFTRKGGGGENMYGSTHFTLWVDCSGSFCEEIGRINSVVHELNELARRIGREFSFDVVQMTMKNRVVSTKAELTSGGCNGFGPGVEECIRKTRKTGCNNYNVVVWDGDMFSGFCRNERERYLPVLRKAFNNQNTVIVTDGDNEAYTRNYTPNARVKVIHDRYSVHFVDALLELLAQVLV